MELFDNSAQWFWQALATLVISVSLFAVYWQVRLQRYAHVIDSTEKLTAIWRSDSYLRIRRQVCSRLLENRDYFGSDCEELLEIFERIGLYVRIGALPKSIVWDAFSWFVEYYYILTKEGIDDLRIQYGDETLFENFTSLAKTSSRMSRSKKTMNRSSIDENNLNSFLQSEIDTASVFLGD